MFEKENIELVVPNNEEKEYIHNKLFSEIEFGIVKEETKKNFLSIIERIEKEEKVEGVILGCTELPMVIEPGDIKIGYLDTTRIHIEAVVDICRRDE
jgi:aspartate racemase